jgi:hypothetical protein
VSAVVSIKPQQGISSFVSWILQPQILTARVINLLRPAAIFTLFLMDGNRINNKNCCF